MILKGKLPLKACIPIDTNIIINLILNCVVLKTALKKIYDLFMKLLNVKILIKLLTIYQIGAVAFTVVTISKVELSPTLNMKERKIIPVVRQLFL